MREVLERRGIGYSASENWSEDLPVIVMVHGAGGSSDIWRSQVHGLQKTARVAALDLPGHGNSKGPAREGIEDYADWLGDFLKEAFDMPVFVVGHSMGGAITQVLAVKYPQMLKGIVLAATGPRLRVAPQFLRLLSEDFENAVERFLGYAYAPEAPKELVRQGIDIMKEAGPDIVCGDLTACDNFSSESFVSSISVPCLIAVGEKDMLTPPSLSEKLNSSIKGSTLKVIDGAGHMLMVERPAAFNNLISQFIRGEA